MRIRDRAAHLDRYGVAVFEGMEVVNRLEVRQPVNPRKTAQVVERQLLVVLRRLHNAREVLPSNGHHFVDRRLPDLQREPR